MTKKTKSEAAKVREAGRKVCRSYCHASHTPTGWSTLLTPCWKCEQFKGGKDCHGNPCGTRERLMAEARAAVIELPKQGAA